MASALALGEYAGIARALGAHVPRAVMTVAVVAACLSVALGAVPLELVLLTALILVGSMAVASGAARAGDPARCGGSAVPRRLHRLAARCDRGGAGHRRPRSGAPADAHDRGQRLGAGPTPAVRSAARRWRRPSVPRKRARARSAGSSRHGGHGRRRLPIFPAAPLRDPRDVCRGGGRRGHRRRPLRVAAQAERRCERLVCPHIQAMAASWIGSTAGSSPARSTTCSFGTFQA